MKSNWTIIISCVLLVTSLVDPRNFQAALFTLPGAHAQTTPRQMGSPEAGQDSLLFAGDEETKPDDAAATLGRLAEHYRDQGLYALAEHTVTKLLNIRESKLGPDDPEISIHLNNLAWIYEAQGKYDEAETLYLRALASLQSITEINILKLP